MINPDMHPGFLIFICIGELNGIEYNKLVSDNICHNSYRNYTVEISWVYTWDEINAPLQPL